MAHLKFYTIWLALICIVFFILQLMISGFTEALVLNEQSFLQPYRFLTAIFLHGSVVHLLYNLFALLLFGLILESIIKSRNFLIVFFSSGILANLIAVNFYPSSLGASGAIFGVIGTLTALRPKMFVWAFGLPMPLFLASLLWLAGDLLGLFFPSNIGNIAHIFGLLFGLLLGIFLRARYKEIKFHREKIKIPETYMRGWEERYVR